MKELIYCSLHHRSCPLTGIDNYDDLKDKLSRRNMLCNARAREIKELKPYKDLVEQILNMTNIHGVYKDDTDCINSIREAISRK